MQCSLICTRMEDNSNKLRFKRLGIDTQHEHFAYMREDCRVMVSEGFHALTRIRITNGGKSIVASLNVIRSGLLLAGELGLSESAAQALGVVEGESLTVSHLQPIGSLGRVRSKIFGDRLDQEDFRAIINDIVAGNYSNIHLSAFITACAGDRMNIEEITYLTRAMIDSGSRIHWEEPLVVDKHCVGGLPGNRTTPIIVSIVAANGLTMPKTSSRAITSPAGTADTMEVMTPVNLDMAEVREVIRKEGGCIAWSARAGLSPADDMLIKIEKALNIDSEGQLIASVISKKVAVGSNHVIIDMPVGETAKLRSIEAANKLKVDLEKVAHEIGLVVKVVITDGSQPVGRGIGPALEARDVLSVLRNEPDAPKDLKERALLLAGELLELSGKVEPGEGNDLARKTLESGKAGEKFFAICEAQGGFREPPVSNYQQLIRATASGTISSIDNRRLAKLAKLAGAPDDKAAGVDFLVKLGDRVEKGQVLFEVHAVSRGELEYAMHYYRNQSEIISIQP